CASCHNKDLSKKLIGPPLKDITDQREEAWLIEWIKDSQAMIKKGDPEALRISKEYNNLVMTPFLHLSDADIKDILAYIKEASKAPAATPKAMAAETEKGTGTSTNEYSLSNIIVLAAIVVLLLAI